MDFRIQVRDLRRTEGLVSKGSKPELDKGVSMENLQTKVEGSFVDRAAVESELKDTTLDRSSLKAAVKSPRRRRRRLAGW